MDDYYEILGVDENASASEIKKAYRKLVKKYHPDNVGSDKYDDLLKKITVAYECLSNPEKRREYDWDRKAYEESEYDDSDSDYASSEESEEAESVRASSASKESSVWSEISWGNFIWFIVSLLIIERMGWDGIFITIYSIGCIIGICGFLIVRIRRWLKNKRARLILILLAVFIGYSYWKDEPSVETDSGNYTAEKESGRKHSKESGTTEMSKAKKESSVEKQAIELAKAYYIEPYHTCSVYEVMEYLWKGGNWSLDNNSKPKMIQYYLDSDNYINFCLDEESCSIDTYVLDGQSLDYEEKEAAVTELCTMYTINRQLAYKLDYMDYAGKDIESLLNKSLNLYRYEKETSEWYLVRDVSANIVVQVNKDDIIEFISIGDFSELADESYSYEMVENYLPSYAGVRVGMDYEDVKSIRKFNEIYTYIEEAVESDGRRYMCYENTEYGDVVCLLLNEDDIIVRIIWNNAVG